MSPSASGVPRFVGWRYAVLVGSLVGAIGLAAYPVIIHPYLYPEEWQKRQKEIRGGQDREKMQPGGMKVWTNPFEGSDAKK